jgi:hypothetical protein
MRSFLSEVGPFLSSAWVDSLSNVTPLKKSIVAFTSRTVTINYFIKAIEIISESLKEIR